MTSRRFTDLAKPTSNRRARYIGKAMVAVLVSTAILTGCSSVVNQGGDTTCKTYLTQDDSHQNDEVTKMLKDESKNEPSSIQVSASRAAVAAYCKTLGNEKSKISEAPHL